MEESGVERSAIDKAIGSLKLFFKRQPGVSADKEDSRGVSADKEDSRGERRYSISQDVGMLCTEWEDLQFEAGSRKYSSRRVKGSQSGHSETWRGSQSGHSVTWRDKEIDSFKAELDRAKKENDSLRADIDKAKKENDGLKAELDTGISTEYIQVTARANTHQQKFLPFIDFSIRHLPACYQHDEMRSLIKSLADLTVKIEVKDFQKRRKTFWKDKRLFLDEESKSKNIILGSGKVEDVILYSEKDGLCPCRCQKCKYVPKQKWGEIRILTSAQLLYDDKDAKQFVCTLFYDDDETSHTITVIGENIVVKNIKRDFCIFTSVTCDLDLIECLEIMLDKFEECWENAFDKYNHSVKWEDEKLIVLVSHPLGYKKHVSIGKKLDCKQDVESKGINYDVPTLPGSRGAFLLVPDFDVVNENVEINKNS